MKTQKMSLANMQGKLSRAEMKNIMAGSGVSGCGGYLTTCDSMRKCCDHWKCSRTSGPGACVQK